MPWSPWCSPYPSRDRRVGPSTSAAAERLACELVRREVAHGALLRRERWATALLAVVVCLIGLSAHLSTGEALTRHPAPLCIQGPGQQLACAAPAVAVQRHGVLAAWFQQRLAQRPLPARPETAVVRVAAVMPRLSTSWQMLGATRDRPWRCGVVGRTLAGAVLVQCGPGVRLGWGAFERY
jgi:hypothetical protein